jgi:hypothetical protein
MFKARFLMLTGFLAFSSLSGCASVAPPAPSPSNSFLLGEAELQRVTARANAGDISAMNTLFMHYSTALGQDEKGFEWLEKAGNAGDIQARYNVVCEYVRHGNTNQKARLSVLSQRWGISPECHHRDGI